MLKRFFGSCLMMVIAWVVIALVAGYFLTRKRPPSVEAGSYLVLNIAGAFAEDAPRDFLSQLIEGRPVTVFDIVNSIRTARFDDRILGVLVDINISELGYGKVQEIRDALSGFRESGKKVVSYIEIGRDIEYYLATAADEIYMAPVSALMVDGIVGNAYFLRGTLDLLGIRPNFVRVGEYKTAVDLFERKEMSDAQRLSMDLIVDGIFTRYVADMADARGIGSEEMLAIIDQGMLDTREAIEKGMVDDRLYRNQLEAKLKGEAEEFQGVDVEAYRDVGLREVGVKDAAKFALIVVDGVINLGVSGDSPDFGKIVGSTTVSDAIQEAVEDDEIEAIILRVDSPGGVWVAADLIWGEVARAVEEKPVVVSMSDVAASGGYYIAMPASAIVAQPGTITGSIGVYAGKFNLSGLYEKIGLNKESISRGKSAEMFSETRDFTEEEYARLHRQLAKFYLEDFVAKVHEGRDITTEVVDSIGGGRIWTGEQAKELGLVDEIGGIWKAVEVARGLAEIPKEREISLVLVPKPKELLELLLEGDLVLDQPAVRLSPRTEALISRIQWANFMGSGEVMAMMPFRIELE